MHVDRVSDGEDVSIEAVLQGKLGVPQKHFGGQGGRFVVAFGLHIRVHWYTSDRFLCRSTGILYQNIVINTINCV